MIVSRASVCRCWCAIVYLYACISTHAYKRYLVCGQFVQYTLISLCASKQYMMCGCMCEWAGVFMCVNMWVCVGRGLCACLLYMCVNVWMGMYACHCVWCTCTVYIRGGSIVYTGTLICVYINYCACASLSPLTISRPLPRSRGPHKLTSIDSLVCETEVAPWEYFSTPSTSTPQGWGGGGGGGWGLSAGIPRPATLWKSRVYPVIRIP